MSGGLRKDAAVETVAIRPARADELNEVAGLRWRWWQETGRTPSVSRAEFVRGFAQWAHDNSESHKCVVMVRRQRVVGMAWLAMTPRVPHPGGLGRTSGDLQSVYVVPEERGRGLGGRLIDAVLSLGRELGLERVVVHSGARAVAAYERSGFAVSPQLMQCRTSG